MLEEEDLLTCEDICDDWFQEPPNDQERTGAIVFCERLHPSEPPTAFSISDASHRWPDALALKLGDEPRQGNGRSGP